MEDVEQLLAQLQAEAGTRGLGWLEETLGNVLGQPAKITGTGGREAPRARRSQPPEHFSPDPAPRPQQRAGSPVRAPSGPPAKRAAKQRGRQDSASPLRQGTNNGWASGSGRAAKPGRWSEQKNAGPAPRGMPARSELQRGRSEVAVAGPITPMARATQRSEADRRRGTPRRETHRGAEFSHTSPRKLSQKSAGGYAARRNL